MSSFRAFPQGWEVKDLRDTQIAIIDGDRGKNYPAKAEFTPEGFCVFLNTGNIKNDSFDFANCDFIDERKDALLRKGRLVRGDLVLTTRGTVGSVAYYHRGIIYDQIRINSGMVVLRCAGGVSSQFFYQLCKSAILKLQFELFSSGSAQPQLPIKDLRRVRLLLPKQPVQEKIAAVLSGYDELIDNTKRRIELLEKMAEDIYREWFVRLRFPGHERAKLENRPLRKFIEEYVGGDWGEDVQSPKFGNPVYVIRGTDFEDIQQGDISYVPFRYITDSGLQTRKLIAGDLIVENSVNHQSRTSGKSLLVTQHVLDLFDGNVVCASFCKLIRPKDSKHSKFLSLNFRLLFNQGLFDYFQNIATNGIANLQAERFMDRHLIPFLDDIDLSIFESLDTSLLAKLLAKLKETRAKLLPRLISGKLSVENLDIRFPPGMAEELNAEPTAIVHA